MSKKGIHRRKVLADGELTLLDFADAKVPRGKACKGKSFKVAKPQVLDLDDVPGEVDIDMEWDGSEVKPRRRQTKGHEEDKNHVYNDYISDVWWLISEHIWPTDVGRFALICKKTEAIVSSARFWINLYKNFYMPRCELPVDLQPDCIKRLGGLRSRVIRSLFYTYKPFVRRLSKTRTNFDFLNGLQCVASWYKQEGKVWMYCFKLFNGVKVRPPPDVEHKSSEDDSDEENFEAFLVKFNNVYENPDEGCSILVFAANRFYPLPNFLGSQNIRLSAVRQPLSRDLTHFNLELDFSNYRNQLIGTAVFPSASNIRVISWWCPDYVSFSNPL